MSLSIPESHIDLLTRPIHGVLSTMMPDGQPQSTMVWVDYDGEFVLISTAKHRRKCRNAEANPRVTLLVIDPQNDSRWMEIRGKVAEIVPDTDYLGVDKLTRLYTDGRSQHFYGDVVPIERRARDSRVILKIEPIKVTLDAVFK